MISSQSWYIYNIFIILKYFALQLSNGEQIIRKWNSSSIFKLHVLQILSSTFKPSYMPLSILKSWVLILNFVYEHVRGHLIHWCSVAVATMTWLSVMEYLCHKWPRICSTCHKHFPVLSSFATYYWVCN